MGAASIVSYQQGARKGQERELLVDGRCVFQGRV